MMNKQNIVWPTFLQYFQYISIQFSNFKLNFSKKFFVLIFKTGDISKLQVEPKSASVQHGLLLQLFIAHSATQVAKVTNFYKRVKFECCRFLLSKISKNFQFSIFLAKIHGLSGHFVTERIFYPPKFVTLINLHL